MSLVHFIAEPDVKAFFKEVFKKPKIKARNEILAPPVSTNYSIVGQALDYLLRFQAEFVNRGKTVSGPWVADLTLDQLVTGSDRKLAAMVSETVELAHREHDKYLVTGTMTDNLIRSAILLAQVDCIYRTGVVPVTMGVPGRKNMDDLKQLVEATDFALIRAKKLCIPNPSFGVASIILNGADGDLLVDDCLIDIKCSKNADSLSASHFNQLMGYYICSRIGGIDGAEAHPGHQIRRLGIYLARRAELIEFDAQDVLPDSELPAIMDWFVDRAGDQLALMEEPMGIQSLDAPPDLFGEGGWAGLAR